LTGYLDKKEAAVYLGYSPRWIEDHLAELPHFRINGRPMFKVGELDEWMEGYRETTVCTAGEDAVDEGRTYR
jgi:hypothetical protein